MTVYTYKFEWPGKDGESVQVTGNFDDWSNKNSPLAFEQGKFKGLIKLEKCQDLIFKFIVNGDWLISKDYPTITDEHGNINNFINSKDLTIFEEFDQEFEDPKDAKEIAKSVSPSSGVGGGEEKEGIQQVLTNSSSFAAVSLPSDASNFEEIEHPITKSRPVEMIRDSSKEDTIKPVETETDKIEIPSTPTKSISNDKKMNDSNSTLNYNYPGSYPISPDTKSSPKPKLKNEKKDISLISKFKGFFKY